MLSALDRRFDEELERVIGPGGQLVIDKDEIGCAVVENFPSTLPELFRIFCALNSANEAVVAGDERFTFGELCTLSDRIAHGLAARGISKGDRVGIAMRNCPSWILLYMAILKAGGVATLLNAWWEAHEMEHAIQLTEPRLIIADETRAERISERCSELDILAVAADLPVEIALQELFRDGGDETALPNASPNEDATILFTSGSTGRCKGAVSTHRAVATATYSYATGLIVLRALLEQDKRPPPTPRTLLSVPLFHVTGEVPIMLNSFVIGRCMVIMPKWDVGEALRLIEKERITYFVGVPTMSLELMNHPDRDKYDLSSLKDITAGGAPRPVSHVERLRKEFPNAQPALGYGLTETNAVGCQNFWSNYADKPGSTGRAAKPFVEIAILGDGESQLPKGRIGEIALRSAANVRGYWRNIQATEDLFTADGFVRTGDVGYLDDDGYLFIVDRKKEIIIRGGENISAAEVEEEFYACSKIAEVSVFGVPDERLGEVPVAIVLPKQNESLSEDGLRTFLDGRLAKFKIPERIIVSNAPLPRLGTGKIDRRALKAQFGT